MKTPPICSALLLFLLAPLPISAQSLTNQPSRELTEIIVLPKHEGQPANWRAESIIEAVKAQAPTPNQVTTLQRVGRPSAADFLIADRMSDEIRALRTVQDPQERLQRYVVLDYPTHQAAEAAYRRLSADAGSLSVEWNAEFEFSAAPNDPMYYPDFYDQNEKNYQWGLHDPMNFEAAWDKTWGTAYVAVLDSGIQQNHPDLSQAFRPQFSYSIDGGTNNVDESLNSGTTGRGHGTHVSGIIAANSHDPSRNSGLLNPAELGVAGGCWSCSLIMVRITHQNGSIDPATIAAGINRAVISGAQVVNMSLTANPTTCANNIWSSVCTALALASNREVVVVAAAGNRTNEGVGFPASDSRVIPVAGIDHNLARWTEDSFGSSTGPELRTRGLAAPAKDILSTVYTNFDWSPRSRCGDQNFFALDPNPNITTPQYPDIDYGDFAGPGFGRCTGTSMAAPHIAAAAALVRTANPLATRATVAATLRATGSLATTPSNELGAGLPNVGVAVANAFGGGAAKNRLTPLFAFTRGGDYRYTVALQAAAAFASPEFDQVLPTSLDKALVGATPVGTTIGGLPTLPGLSVAPKAQLLVYSGHINPNVINQALVPLLRFSRPRIGLVAGDFAYETNEVRAQALLNAGYRRDGVEGFMFSTAFSQPAGTVRVYRARNSASGDNAVFPDTQLASMTAAGYSADQFVIGYAYLNLGTLPK